MTPRAWLTATGADRRRDRTTPSAGTTEGSHFRAEATTRGVLRQTGPTVHRRTGPSSRAAGARRLQQPRRDRQVAREIGERPVPADEDGELVEPEARPERRHDRPIGRAADPQRERAARLRPPTSGARGPARAAPRRGPPRARAGRPRRRSRIRSACRPDRGRASRAAIRCAGSGDRPGGRRRAARDRGHRSPRPASDGRHRRAARPASSSNGSGTTPEGSSPNASGRRGSPIRLSSGMRGTMPERRVHRVRDRLDAVGRGRPGHPVVGGEQAGEQVAPKPGALELGQDEQHREIPQPLADDRRAEGDDPVGRGRVAGATMLLRHGRDDEPFRVGRLEVDEQAGRPGGPRAGSRPGRGGRCSR